MLGPSLKRQFSFISEAGDTALEDLNTLLKERKLEFGDENIKVAHTYRSLAFMYDKEGQLDESISAFKRAVDITQQCHGSDHVDVAKLLNNLGSVMAKAINTDGSKAPSDYDDVLTCYHGALQIFINLYGSEHQYTKKAQLNIARCYEYSQKLAKETSNTGNRKSNEGSKSSSSSSCSSTNSSSDKTKDREFVQNDGNENTINGVATISNRKKSKSFKRGDIEQESSKCIVM